MITVHFIIYCHFYPGNTKDHTTCYCVISAVIAMKYLTCITHYLISIIPSLVLNSSSWKESTKQIWASPKFSKVLMKLIWNQHRFTVKAKIR